MSNKLVERINEIIREQLNGSLDVNPQSQLVEGNVQALGRGIPNNMVIPANVPINVAPLLEVGSPTETGMYMGASGYNQPTMTPIQQPVLAPLDDYENYQTPEMKAGNDIYDFYSGANDVDSGMVNLPKAVSKVVVDPKRKTVSKTTVAVSAPKRIVGHPSRRPVQQSNPARQKVQRLANKLSAYNIMNADLGAAGRGIDW